MKIKFLVLLSGLVLLFSQCAVMQSAVKSTFPYSCILILPRNAQVGTELSAVGTANSFDQRISKNGSNTDKIGNVRVVSARLVSRDPSDFNIGNLVSVMVYLAKGDGSREVLVASRSDITAGVGSSMVLDIDNSAALDQQLRDPNMQVRVVYQLRNHINVTANLKLVLAIAASAAN